MTLGTRVSKLGYSLRTKMVDHLGRKRKYRTSPAQGSGPVNYFDSANSLRNWVSRVERDRVSFAANPTGVRSQGRVAKYFVFKQGSSTALGGWSTREQAEKTARIYATGSGSTFVVRAGGSGKSKLLFTARPAHANPGPSAIPARWTPATVSRKGGQIQIRMGGR
jgi:hypothetical protein